MSPDLIRTLLNIKACAIVASSHSLASIFKNESTLKGLKRKNERGYRRVSGFE